MAESGFRQKTIALFPSLHPHHAWYKWFVLFAVMLGTFMVILDGTIVNVAIPTIMAAFGKSISEVVWVSTAYLIALSVLLAVAGWLSDHFGAKRVYMIGLVIFTASSYLCGISWNLHALVFFRILQGIGGGLLIPVGMSLFTAEFPPEDRTIPFGFYSIAVAAAISLGPSFGGYLIEAISWGWIFFVNVPVGIISLGASAIIFKTARGKKILFFDFWGLLWLATFLIALIVGISSGNSPWNAEGWTSTYTITAFVISIIAFILFLWVELRIPDPIVDLTVFKDRNFLMGNIVLFIFSFTLFGSSFLLPLYLQNGLDYSKIRTGLVLLPIGLVQGIFGAATGWLVKIISPKFLVLTGIICLGISYCFNAKFTLYTEEATILWLFSFRGFAMALMFAPLVSMTLSTITEEKMPQATGLFTVQRQIGAAMGVAVFETIFATRQIYHGAAYGQVIDTTSPVFESVKHILEQTVTSHFGSNPWNAIQQANILIHNHIDKNIFIRAIDDNLLIAGVITFFSCLPLFFLKKVIKTL
jgi:DHA2 family multidrug resistance protein